MKLSSLWKAWAGWLHGKGGAIARFFGPFRPNPEDVHSTMRQSADFRFQAAYGRFAFQLHAPASRMDALSQVQVHEAFEGSQPPSPKRPSRSSAEMAQIARMPRR
jgi:hypothetical protein